MSQREEIIKQYAEMGQRWLNGEIEVEEWHMGEKQIKLNEKQKEFINSKERFVLISGGFASGKTTALIMKLVLLCLWFPNNRILLGRRTRAELEKVTLPDFFDICPREWAEYKMGPGLIRFFNGSEIILFGLDALQDGSGQDIKKAEQQIKSLNLGGFAIDQLEEVEERVVQALRGRMRRNVGFQQAIASTNPANFWAYDYFKANPREGTKLIEVSMMDNKAHLSEEYIKDQLNNPKNWVERYVYGTWSPDVMSEAAVFAEEYIKEQAFHIKTPVRTFDGIKIFQEPDSRYEYQIGADPSDGAIDPCSVKVFNITTGEEAASFGGFVPTAVQVEKIVQLAYMYALKKKPLVVVEINASGSAVIESLKGKYDKLYEREVFNYRERRKSNKLGWQTNSATKKLLIEKFNLLLKQKFVKIRERETLEEMKVFIYSDEARLKGAGAQHGFHDDRVMASMLALVKVNPPSEREKNLMKQLQEKERHRAIKYQFS